MCQDSISQTGLITWSIWQERQCKTTLDILSQSNLIFLNRQYCRSPALIHSNAEVPCAHPGISKASLTKQPQIRLFRDPLTRQVDRTVKHLCANSSSDRPDNEDSEFRQWWRNVPLNMKIHVQLDTHCPEDDGLRYENAWESDVS
jgi:hypothetical protein